MGPVDRARSALLWMAALGACGGPEAGGGGSTAPVVDPPATITAADLEADVRYLASDALLGRETGSEGEALAAAHIEARLQRAGLSLVERQPTDVIGWTPSAPFEIAFVDAQGVETLLGADADGSPEFLVPRPGRLDGSLEAVVARSPEEVPATPRAEAALILLATPREWQSWLGEGEGRGWGLVMAATTSKARAARPNPPAHVATRAGDGARPPVVFLFAAARARLEAAPPARVRVAMRGSEPRTAHNVIGVLRGAGAPGRPELAGQAIVLSAHYDHIGVAPAAPAPAAEGAAAPDRIHNGADDDASGVAAVLELAEAFGARARAGRPPARTLVFLLATGEEHGLLGTDHYLEHPAVPLEQTVANVNFEMIGRPDALAGGPGRLWLTGFERTNLGAAWAAAGLPIVPDARPDQHFYERSDNMAFVRRGIVGQSLSSFDLHDDYHTPADEADRLDYAHMQGAVRAAYSAVVLLADGSVDPAWAPAPAPAPAEAPR